MSYFQYIPIIQYFGKSAPNILTRVKLDSSFVNNRTVYHPYTIEDGDRPDTIAGYYYGDPTLDWLVRLANNINDETTQWPLTQDQLESYINNKYGSIYTTYSTIDHYILKTNVNNISSGQYSELAPNQLRYWLYNSQFQNYAFTNGNYVITPDAFTLLNSNEQIYWQPVMQYDNEFNINEAKRNIMLIDKTYSTQLNSVLRELFTNGQS